MILNFQTYSKILAFIQRYHRLDSVCFDALFRSFPEIDKSTLASILHSYIKKRTMITTRRIKNDIEDICRIYTEMVKEGKTGIFLYLAEKYRVTPVSIARHVIEFLESNRKGINQKNINKKKLSSKDLIWDSTLIDDGVLAYEVHIASLFDNSYSQIAHIVTSLSGKEYELYLQSCLYSQGLSFKTENELRNLNFSKTPDILLDVPFATGNFIIKWIESKACFGDDSLHEDYLLQQYQHYYRFGSGLVIYWYGFVETIKNVNKKLLVSDQLPTNIVKIC